MDRFANYIDEWLASIRQVDPIMDALSFASRWSSKEEWWPIYHAMCARRRILNLREKVAVNCWAILGYREAVERNRQEQRAKYREWEPEVCAYHLCEMPWGTCPKCGREEIDERERYPHHG